MQQIYRRTPMPKCDFNKVALQLYWNRTSAWVFSCKFSAYFWNTFPKEHLWVAASEKWIKSMYQGKWCDALLTDLSRAFDCIVHGFLIANLEAYGFSYVNVMHN